MSRQGFFSIGTAAVILAILTAFGIWYYEAQKAPIASYNVTGSQEIRQKVCELPSGGTYVKFSEDGRHCGYSESLSTGKMDFVIDGVPGPVYDYVDYSSLQLSRDGQHYAYIAKNGTHYFAVIDGQEGNPYESVGFIMPGFSIDGTKFFYIAHRNKKYILVKNRVEIGIYDDINTQSFRFSPDGNHTAYVAREGDPEAMYGFMFVDDKEYRIKNGTFSFSIVFSPDSNHFAYIAYGTQRNLFLVLDGKIVEEIGNNVNLANPELIFSPNSKKLAYLTYHNRAGIVEYDIASGAKSENGPYIEVRYLTFSPDGKRLAYQVTSRAEIGGDQSGGAQSGQYLIVVGDKLGRPYDAVGAPRFSPDSKSVAYRADKNGFRVGAAKITTVFNDEEMGDYDYPSSFIPLMNPQPLSFSSFDILKLPPVFSPDGEKLAYIAADGSKEFVILGDRRGRSYDSIYEVSFDNILFSPDGKIIAYVAWRDNKKFIVVGDEEGIGYDDVWGETLKFSPDNSKISFVARSGKEVYFVERPLKQR